MRIGVRQPRAKALLARLFQAGLQAVDPYEAVRRQVRIRRDQLIIGSHHYSLAPIQRIVVVGAGKASGRMAQALEHQLGARIDTGLVVVKYGHGAPTHTIRIVEAGHPIPDTAGLEGGRMIMEMVQTLTSADLLIVLLSGGASSLIPAPVAGITLKDKQQTTKLLLRSGATIQEINAVRKHLSSIKGGQLAAATSARVASVILSDVIGNDLGTIGSGPTAPDATRFQDAWDIVERYGVSRKIPLSVRRHLESGLKQGVPETPKPRAKLFRRVENILIGDNRAAVDAVAETAQRQGLHTLVLATTLTGEARELAKFFGAMAREIAAEGRPIRRPCCVIAGGEPTVTIRGEGKGGRAQEFALAAAAEVAGLPEVWVAGFATDGTDGPTSVAGAVVDGRTVVRAQRKKLNLAKALQANDAHPFFEALHGHIVTGPTGTNVNDLYLLLAL
ncbi:glycerate kinase type-2 family protein [Nitrospira defluvii]|uniref:Glycerate 2-kinase n=1 Tax=Nitrospira defluvii TaxID=330214 RepID=A0ABN7KNB7_9BACT|nr:glycerate kinase [Nitrospira defluvii]CAE6702373.1 Glycerate 2-kinase [Nitrospira defluvii]